MKTKTLLIAIMMTLGINAFADFSCVSDEAMGRGDTENDARAAAAEACFSGQLAQYESSGREIPGSGTEQADMIMNHCVNTVWKKLKCKSI